MFPELRLIASFRSIWPRADYGGFLHFHSSWSSHNKKSEYPEAPAQWLENIVRLKAIRRSIFLTWMESVLKIYLHLRLGLQDLILSVFLWAVWLVFMYVHVPLARVGSELMFVPGLVLMVLLSLMWWLLASYLCFVAAGKNNFFAWLLETSNSSRSIKDSHSADDNYVDDLYCQNFGGANGVMVKRESSRPSTFESSLNGLSVDEFFNKSNPDLQSDVTRLAGSRRGNVKLSAATEGFNDYNNYGTETVIPGTPKKDSSPSAVSASEAKKDDSTEETDPQEVAIDAHNSDIQIESNDRSNSIGRSLNITPNMETFSTDGKDFVEHDDVAPKEEDHSFMNNLNDEHSMREDTNDSTDSRKRGAALRRSPRPRAKGWEEGRALLRDEQPSVTFRRLDAPDINELMHEDALSLRLVNSSGRPKQTLGTSASPANLSGGVLDTDDGGDGAYVLSLATNFFKSLEGKKKEPFV
jgi:hypothetical protein